MTHTCSTSLWGEFQATGTFEMEVELLVIRFLMVYQMNKYWSYILPSLSYGARHSARSISSVFTLEPHRQSFRCEMIFPLHQLRVD